jgi:KaiC/GvpD/RAD55 family RecA-like ATPase
MAKDEPDNRVFLQTGDKEFDNLLNAGIGGKGLCVGRLEKDKVKVADGKVQFDETSIVLIEGGAGTGKTTLALQIASAVAGNIREKEPKKWSVIFLSLEQTPSSLRHVAESFGFGGEDGSRMFPKLDAGTSLKAHKVLFSRLSPLPLSESKKDTTAEDIFETRFAELQSMVLKVIKQSSVKKDYKALFVIDSLSAFIGKPLERSQLYQLFTLFRAQKIPLIVTLEQPDNTSSGGGPEFEIPCFLADIVIKLTRESGSGYLQFFLEISKSRVCRQGLGKHLYKTRTKTHAEEADDPLRKGLVVYPSVHFILDQSRKEKVKSLYDEFQIDDELTENLELEESIKLPACFALQGPAGTHKLALGLNLGISYVPDASKRRWKQAKLLVVAFGGQGEIKFEGVAWLKHQSYLSKLTPITDKSATPIGGTKEKRITYYAEDSVQLKKAEVAVLTFQIGELTPEECIYKIRKVLKEEEGEDDDKPKAKQNNMERVAGSFQSVLISDTAELCTGFPLLSKDPMFFAALLDLFASKRLLTVGLGVRSPDSPYLRDINLALMAKATHRMVFEHYPKIDELMKGIVDREKDLRKQPNMGQANEKDKSEDEAGKGPHLKEQLVSVVIDNVTGKHYKREPKWIRVPDVEVKEGEPKLLECLPFKYPDIQWLEQSTADSPSPSSK